MAFSRSIESATRDRTKYNEKNMAVQAESNG